MKNLRRPAKLDRSELPLPAGKLIKTVKPEKTRTLASTFKAKLHALLQNPTPRKPKEKQNGKQSQRLEPETGENSSVSSPPPSQKAPKRKRKPPISSEQAKGTQLRQDQLLSRLLEKGLSYDTDEEILEAVEDSLRVAVILSGATAGYIMLVNPLDFSLINEVAISIGTPRDCPLSRGFGEGIEGRVAIGKTPLVLSQSSGGSAKSKKGQSPSVPDLPTGASSGLCLPLLQSRSSMPQIGLLGVMTLLHHEKDKAFSEELIETIQIITVMVSGALDAMIELLDKRERMMQELNEIVEQMENKDNSTRGHSQRVAEICLRIGARFGLDTEAMRLLRTGALLHEIGKVRIDDEILLKPGRLTDEEFGILRMYPIYGYQMCEPLGLSSETLMLIRNHAERLDGSGYPDRLKMGDIPLPLRILSVADAFDAMSSHRSYRAGMGHRERTEQLNRFAGTQFDPTVVETLKNLLQNGDLDDLYYTSSALEQMHAA